MTESSPPNQTSKPREPNAPLVGLSHGVWDQYSDLELLQTCGENLEAFGELIRRHQDFVFGAAMRVVRNRPTAEELTHETFLRAYRAHEGFRGEASVRSWLYRIATNLAKNYISRRKEIPTGEDLDRPTVEDPGARLTAEALTEDVRAAIDQLPSSLREPLVLREYEELSYAEIADRMEIPVNTVRTRILRARRALRPHLEEWR